VTDAATEELPPLRLTRSLLAVAGGGAAGTLVRAEILAHWNTLIPNCASVGFRESASCLAVPSSWSSLVPWWLLVINTVGVFIAAWLLAGPLAGRSPDDTTRLFVITGVLGGLTSYSSLIRDLAAIKSASLAGAILTLVVALAAGLVAAWMGVRVARK
jgi:CrcB protein